MFLWWIEEGTFHEYPLRFLRVAIAADAYFHLLWLIIILRFVSTLLKFTAKLGNPHPSIRWEEDVLRHSQTIFC